MICPLINDRCLKDQCECFYTMATLTDDNEFVSSQCCCNPIYKYHPDWDEDNNCLALDWEMKEKGD